MLSVFVIISAAAVESRYPYDDTYTPGDIVPGLNGRYGRESGFVRKHGPRGGYSPILPKKTGYGKHREDGLLNRDYRRRYKDHDYNLPPRGLGGHGYDRQYERPGYDYGRGRPHVGVPPRYYDEDQLDYGGYRKSNIGRGTRYT